MVQIKNLKNQAVIADKCHVAEYFLDRLRGLMGKASLQEGEAMWFPRCNSIHMWFMRMPLDVVFLKARGNHWVVTSTFIGVRPWRFLPLFDWRATDVVECASGMLLRNDVKVGDEICIS